uniref:Uncharacterized protein n=1 Tax=Fagus sylvatica TaxID=28930 RepID=A0A2N9HVW1_FAGSY
MPHFQAPWPKLSSLPPLKAAAPPLMMVWVKPFMGHGFSSNPCESCRCVV